MGSSLCLLVAALCLVLLIPSTHELQQSQVELLLELRKHLEYPSQLDIWENYHGDLCSMPPSPHMSIVCHGDSIVELQIVGDKSVHVRDFNGFPLPNRTLSRRFSMESLTTTLAKLTSLKVIWLVSLGMWGKLSDNLHKLYYLEMLDLSSNFLFGRVPPRLSKMEKLNSIILDENYFNGTVPDWLHSFPNLRTLSLKNNRFDGNLPSSIGKISPLVYLALSHNKLTGSLPSLGPLTNLRMLDLRDNRFDSELPSVPKRIITVLVSENTFSGKIPEEFGQLRQLQHLDLSMNHLSGTPPSSLFSLPSISYLNLAFNSFSGLLPIHLSCSKNLGFVDISNNDLFGILPHCLNSSSGTRVVKYGSNCLLSNVQKQRQKSYCSQLQREEDKRRGFIIVAAIGALIVMVMVALGLIVLCKKINTRSQQEHQVYFKPAPHNEPFRMSHNPLAHARLISEAIKMGPQGSPICRVFAIEELKEATNNFHPHCLLGEGYIGKVYKGKLKNEVEVAIRSLNLMKKQSLQSLKIKLDLLSKLCHPHLVTLLGHCIHGDDDSGGKKVLLVYEFVQHGNYREQLAETSPQKALRWSDRLVVLVGVAKAVHFLHTGVVPGTVNNRLKTNNILLDEHRIAKLSDYGMHILTEEIEKLEVQNREGAKPGYRIYLEDDVYNFGFILLESLVGPIVTGKGEAFLLREMGSFGSQDGRRRVVDPIVLSTSCPESLSIAVSLTSKCICADPSARPSLEDVLWNLQYAAQVQATVDADQKTETASRGEGYIPDRC